MLHPSSVRPFLLFILILAGAWSAPAKAQWIDGGGFHTCALNAAGTAFCWGADTHGQLGDGTAGGSRATVAAVSGLADGLITISAGSDHACALTSGQGVKCWGQNLYGQLGDGTNQDSAVPVDVQGLTSGVSEISVGGSHTCAILLTGAMKCWGYNSNGQLGDGTTTDRNAPVDVLGLPGGVAGMSAGVMHTCALTPSGGVKCWGENFLGALGDGTRTDRNTPVDVVGLASGVVSVAAGGGHTCAMGSQGLWLRCWGRNEYGQVGDNSYTFAFHTEPVNVANLPGSIAMIAAGLLHTCLLTTGGDVSCWGANEYGQLANGGTGWGSPFPVPSLTGGVTRIGAGFYHSCAVSTDGLARCWGRNDNGQLGDGTSGTNRTSPVVVAGFFAGGGATPSLQAQSVAAGGVVTCALNAGGGVDCWGENAYGALGDGTSVSRSVAGPVSGLSSGVASVSAGWHHVCAITTAGGVKCWGDNTLGRLGIGTGDALRRTPTDVAGLASGVAAVTTGYDHTCALTAAGGVKCWGSNISGQLGYVTAISAEYSPRDVPGLESGALAVSASMSSFHTCALLATGGVRCWGANLRGQLGDGTLNDSTSPVDVAGLPADAVAVSTGAEHSCALTAQGGVSCWGANQWGQLGDGTSTDSTVPVAVTGLPSGVAAIAAGGYHTCAILASGGVQCWGMNVYGELGDGTAITQRGVPDYVLGLTSGVVELSAGYRHSCVRMADDTLRCWGFNQEGQLGIGNTTNQVTPAGVVTYMGGDIVPDVFSFTPATGVALGALVTSGPVTITGITMPAIVSVTGGEYSVGCTATYTADAGVVLAGQSVCVRHTASASPSASTTTTLTVSTVSASFTSTTSGGVVLQEYPLTVTKSGTGGGTVTSNPVGIACGATCQFPFGDATVVSLTATADAGSAFTGWSGACTGTGACSFTMSQARSVTASFSPTPAGTAQYITFGQQLDRAVGSPPFNVFAFASSGLPITFSSQTPGVCTVSGNTATIVAAGTCTIAADQGGNATFGPALTVVRSFAVGATPDLADVAAIGVGGYHTCAVLVAGGAKCWGSGLYGQLGYGSSTDGPTSNRPTPVDVWGLGSGVVAVTAGGIHTCALTASGGVKCWGENVYGAVGDGSTTGRETPVDVSGLSSGVAAVEAGSWHTCALTASGGVKCWGRNNYDQLGDGSATNRLSPVDVSALTSGVAAVSAGHGHTCALTQTGGVKCWGDNQRGQLGDGSVISRVTPVDVVGLTAGVVAIAAGESHSCGITTQGDVKCWGDNNHGQLGDGAVIPDTTAHLTPVDVTGLPGKAVAITVGATHTCALTAAGAMKCWGGNSQGQLGDSTLADRSVPGDVPGLESGVVSVAAGFNATCALIAAGGVKCWGRNFSGGLGDGSYTDRVAPVVVVGLFGGDATPEAFSFTPQNGVPAGSLQTSNAATINGIAGPVAVSVGNGSYSIGCGATFTSDPGVITNGQAVCVRHVAAATPATVTTTTLTVGGISASFVSTTSSGVVLQEYPLTVTKSGTGSGTVTSNPVGINCGATCQFPFGDATVVSLTATADAGSVFAGWSGACTGTGACSFTMSQARSVTATFALVDTTPDAFSLASRTNVLPGATVTSAPVTITGINAPAPVSVANGYYAINCQDPYISTPGTITNGQTICVQHAAAATPATGQTSTLTVGGVSATFTSTTGKLAQAITFGQLPDRGVGSAPFSVSAFASSGLPISFSSQTPSVCTVAGGTVTVVAEGMCSIAADQAGDAAHTPAPQVVRSFIAAKFADPGDVAAIAAGLNHVCVLTRGGGVKCWGDNSRGQLGDGTTTGRPAPVNVTGLTSGVVAITAGGSHTCAITGGGGMKCWGGNDYGQIGDGSTTQRLTPVDVSGLGAGVTSIAAGRSHTCAITGGGGMMCWGGNLRGQVGDGSQADRRSPVDVSGLGSGVVEITAGGGHTCAITGDGGMKCWGDNSQGQLGDGTTTGRLTPVNVAGMTSGVVAISAGEEDLTCALTASGGVKCWGRNSYGQIGDGSFTQRLTPVDVSGLGTGILSIAAGSTHACALTMNGGVKCWGFNGLRALGDGTTNLESNTPVDVSGLGSGVTEIAASRDFSCALTTNGGVKCWGDNGSGQLGLGILNIPLPLTPTDFVVGLSGMDGSPDAFMFVTRMGVPISSVQISAAVLPAGFYDPAALSVEGGEYSIGCTGAFVSTPGTIQPGESVCLRHVASGGDEGIATTTLTIGGVSGTFTSITAPRGALILSPARLDFAPRQVGSTSAAQVVTVTNSSFAPITGLQWGVIADFVIESTTCTSTLGFGASCTISIVFRPIALGERADDLLVYATSLSAVSRALLSGVGLASDVTPNAFTFVDELLVVPSKVITSAPVQVTGLTGAATVTVANGSYCVSATNSCSSCTFRQDPSTITDGQYLCARHTSSPIPGGQVDTLVFVGGMGDAFTSITIDTVPAAFSFPPANGVAPSSTQTSAAAAIVGINAPTPVSVSGGTYSVGCTGSYTASPGTITNGQTVCVRHTAGSSAGATVSTTLEVGGVTATFASKVIEANPALSVSPAELSFDGQSMNTTAPARIVTITNTGTGPLTVDSVTASTWFTVAHACANLSAGASCPVSVRFTPAAEGALNGTLSIATSAGSQSVALTGTGERSFTTHYYQAILRRAPDVGGKAFWESEAVRMRDLGASVNETWFAMASYFFTSPEYLAFGRDDAGFATDLYTTFFNRAPDAGGLAFWTAQLAAGMPREVMLASFMFSPEFVGFTEALFGVNAVRKEVDMVVDFYRGLLARLPDTDGFAYWVGQFRQAQCQGAGAVTNRAETISSAFGLSPEYASRARTNEQYVGDLYNSFLRRGGDLGGVQFWIGEIASGARTREQVRQAFVASAEFQGRVAGVIAQGCAP